MRGRALATTALAGALLFTVAQVHAADVDLAGVDQVVPALSGTGAVTNSGGADARLTIGDGANTTYSGNIQDGASRVALTKDGAGIYTLNGVLTYTGNTIVNAGTLTVTGANRFSVASQTIVNTAGTLDLNANAQAITNVSLAGGRIANGTLTATGGVTSTGGAISANLAGATALTATSGTTVLSGTNTATGLTTINNLATVSLTGSLASALNNAGRLDTNGTLNGAVTNTGTINASGGTFRAAVTNNSGGTFNATNTVSTTTTFTNAAGATLNSAGTLTFGGLLTNVGQLNVTAGTLNATAGGLTNSGTITVSNGATLRDALNNTGTVNNSGAYVADVATNTGTITNNLLGTWTGSVQSNAGTITNLGTWTAATIVNGGAFTSSGALTATGAVSNSNAMTLSGTAVLGALTNTGVLTSSGQLSVSGALNNNAATMTLTGVTSAGSLNNSGTLSSSNTLTVTGALTNSGSLSLTGAASAGSFSNSGTYQSTGAFTVTGSSSNTGTYNVVGNASLGTFSNLGTMNSYGARTLTVNSFTNAASGLINLQQTAAPVATDRLTIRGTYIGASNSTMAMDIDLNASGGATRGDSVQITGVTSGATRVRLRNIGTGVYSLLTSPITIVDASPGATFTASTDATTTAALAPQGLISYSFKELTAGSGKWGVAPAVAAASAAQAGTQMSSLMTMLNTTFFQNPSSFLTAHENQDPNQFRVTPWIRFGATNFGLRSRSTPGPLEASTANVRSRATGYQAGADIGVYNIQNSGLGLRAGFTAGEITTSDTDRAVLGVAGQSRSSSSEIPFWGVYSSLSFNGLFVDASWRRDRVNMVLNNTTNGAALLTRASVKTDATTTSGTIGYKMETDGLFVEPAVTVATSRTAVPDTVLSGGYGTVAFGSVTNVLGNLRARFGYDFIYAGWALQAYGSVGVWNEFAHTMNSAFTFNGSQLPIYTSRAGYFGQFSAGLNAKLMNSGLSGYARADMQSGYNVQGTSVTGGMRYQF